MERLKAFTAKGLTFHVRVDSFLVLLLFKCNGRVWPSGRGLKARQSNITLLLNNFYSDAVQVKLWNVETKECAMAFKGHNAEASTICKRARFRK